MMIGSLRKLTTLSLVSFLLASCGSSEMDDLIAFMAEAKSRPVGTIEPIPAFNPYRPFDYSATILRAPFDRPAIVREVKEVNLETVSPPNPNRPKEYLEQYNIESLQMVGTLEQYGQLWALIDDGRGNVHYVKPGNYLGKNHGQIDTLGQGYISVTEIVTNGTDGWVERPRTLELRE
jgi:type IV pilus assembly protein PilP